MKTEKKTILIIGAYGFLGHHLLIKFSPIHQVVIAVKSTSIMPKVLAAYNFETFYVDSTLFLSDLKRYNFDCVINAAVDYGRKSSPDKVWENNVILPQTILEATLHKNLVFIHFDTFYNKFPNYNKLPEYQSSKTAFNEFLKNTSQGKMITLQLEHLYGPRDNKEKFFPKLFEQLISENKEIQLTTAVQKRDFIFITDLVELIAIIIRQKESLSLGFYTFEVGTGKSTVLKLFIDEAKRQLKSTSKLVYGALPTDENEIMESCANINTVQQHFYWKPKVFLEEGISRLINYRKNHE